MTETAIGLHQGIALRTDGISSFSIGYGIKTYSIEYGNSAGPSGDGSDGISLGALNTIGLDISFLGSLGDRIRAGAKAFNINSPSLGNANMLPDFLKEHKLDWHIHLMTWFGLQ